jgi:hypothetical protein
MSDTPFDSSLRLDAVTLETRANHLPEKNSAASMILLAPLNN